MKDNIFGDYEKKQSALERADFDTIKHIEFVASKMESFYKELKNCDQALVMYNDTLEKLGDVKPRRVDIQEIADFDKPGMGILLSALINLSDDDTFVIPKAPSYTGIKLDKGKRILSRGPFGDFVGLQMIDGYIEGYVNAKRGTGRQMKSGEIKMYGNTGDHTGSLMSGGSITIHGEAKGATGNGMSGGKIIIAGNDANDVGTHMKGGELIVKGSVEDNCGAEMENGEINVLGNTRSLLGIGMSGGKIKVEGHCTGHAAGCGMKGGEIEIMGSCYNYEMAKGKTGGKLTYLKSPLFRSPRYVTI